MLFHLCCKGVQFSLWSILNNSFIFHIFKLTHKSIKLWKNLTKNFIVQIKKKGVYLFLLMIKKEIFKGSYSKDSKKGKNKLYITKIFD